MSHLTSDRQSCLAIITARADSKGVKNKNLRTLGRKPTIAYTIESGLACPYIDEVLLTTDSPELRDIGLSMGVTAPFLRPSHLATDIARQEDAVLHAMDWYEQEQRRFDLICLLEPTVPLRRVNTLNRGFQLLANRSDADAVFSVAETSLSPIYCNTLRPDGTLKDFIPKEYIWANRQEVPTFHKLVSLVTICRWDVFKEKETFLLDTTLALQVDPIEAIDIDEPLDFVIVDHLVQLGMTNTSSLATYING